MCVSSATTTDQSDKKPEGSIVTVGLTSVNLGITESANSPSPSPTHSTSVSQNNHLNENSASSSDDDLEQGRVDCLCKPVTLTNPYEISKALLSWLSLNRQQILSGITVSLAQVPEAVAFALVAGLDPLIGLQAAWVMGVLTSTVGGRPGMISGASGATAVVMVDLVANEGAEYLFVTVMIAGIMQIAFGLLGGGKLIRMIPHPVVVGFCNGLAIVICFAQLSAFKVKTDDLSADGDATRRSLLEGNLILDEETSRRHLGGTFGPFTNGKEWVSGKLLVFMICHVLIAVGFTYTLPKFTMKFPSSLAGILVASIVEWAVFRQIGDKEGSYTVEDIAIVQGTFPYPVWFNDEYDMPPLNADTFFKCFPTALRISSVGIIESLMTLDLIDALTNTKGSPNREAVGQGVGQLVSGFLGGMGGDAMLGQSMINVKSGGTTRLSGFIAGIFLLFIILVAYPLINLIPVASLSGVMFVVVYHTFEWSSIRVVLSSALPLKWRSDARLEAYRKVNRSDAVIIVIVVSVSLIEDLATGVFSGIILAALVFSWTSGGAMTVERGEVVDDVVVYDVTGNLFFASIHPFMAYFNAKSDPPRVIVSFDNADIVDWSALEAINALAEKYEAEGKKISFTKLSFSSQKVLTKARKLLHGGVDLEDDNIKVESIETEASMAIGTGFEGLESQKGK